MPNAPSLRGQESRGEITPSGNKVFQLGSPRNKSNPPQLTPPPSLGQTKKGSRVRCTHAWPWDASNIFLRQPVLSHVIFLEDRLRAMRVFTDKYCVRCARALDRCASTSLHLDRGTRSSSIF
eukprot:6201899-Pleurochrysis_carterae.AAC.3